MGVVGRGVGAYFTDILKRQTRGKGGGGGEVGGGSCNIHMVLNSLFHHG